MRTDFREERKWKLSAAFQLARAARAWHAHPDRASRVAAGVCIAHAPLAPPDAEMAGPGPADDADDVEAEELLGCASSDEDDSGDEADAGAARMPALSLEQRAATPTLKVEDVDEHTALIQTGPGEALVVEKVEDPPAGALKPGAGDPVLGAAKAHGPVPAAYVPVRERLVHAEVERLFVDGADLAVARADDAHGLPALFPELAMYGLLDPTPAPARPAKKKASKEDKDDPARRADDAYYARLVPLNAFMLQKPTLVSALLPAEHWDAESGWHDLDSVPISVEGELPPPPKGPDDHPCSTPSPLGLDVCSRRCSALRPHEQQARAGDHPVGPEAVRGGDEGARGRAQALRGPPLVRRRGPAPEGALRPLPQQLAPHLRLVQRRAAARAARPPQPVGLRRALAAQVGALDAAGAGGPRAGRAHACGGDGERERDDHAWGTPRAQWYG
jgi:hypothetical protein